jgi:hypothetical protein
MTTWLVALPVHTWEQFLALDNQQPFNIILIHHSMLQQVDLDWMSAAYRSGIDVRRSELGQLVGDRCLGKAERELLDHVDHTFLYFTYNVTLENEAYRDYVHQRALEDCDEDFKGIGKAFITHGTHEFPIATEAEIEHMAKVMLVDTVNYDIPVPR